MIFTKEKERKMIYREKKKKEFLLVWKKYLEKKKRYFTHIEMGGQRNEAGRIIEKEEKIII